MDRLCDEIIQLIFYELHDPTSFTLVSKRFRELSQDPYVRAHYFLTRNGKLHAMYWALGRGRVLTDRVIDILLCSGATLSRYLIQVAIHHYFRTTSHSFIKTTWVRTVPFPVFTYFLKVSSDLYGEIPLAKGEDDGSIFSSFLKESRLPDELKSVSWENVRDVLQDYKFIPFHIKDNLMAQFPLALSIEPRLLPLAVANGFHMDSKYRDFVFRKMFEKPGALVSTEGRVDTIVANVRELRRLDSSMFLSRTVAGEVCMEAKMNELAYAALKKLDQSGDLLFELSTLVEDLIKLFLTTRSITSPSTIAVLRTLYADFPSQDPTVRLVLLLTVFLTSSSSHHERVSSASLKTQLEALGLTPLTKKDIFNVMLNPFIEKFSGIVEYAKVYVGLRSKEVKELLEEVAIKCLEVSCKGKMLKRLVESYPMLRNTIATLVVEKYQLDLDDLPRHEDDDACRVYEARLCRDYCFAKSRGVEMSVDAQDDGGGDDVVMGNENGEGYDEDEEQEQDEQDELSDGEEEIDADGPELGQIGQDSLSTMIHREEMLNRFSRRRSFYGYNYTEITGKMTYPADALQVGKWIKEQFGLRSNITAVFMTHAVINDTLGVYLTYNDVGLTSHVPITLHHFKILARLGRPINWTMLHEIEAGAEFFFSEDDYLNKQPKLKIKTEVKTEVAQSPVPSTSNKAKLDKEIRRPRRTTAATIKSYTVPDSDDDDIAEEAETAWAMHVDAKKRKVESKLQRWIKELSVLLKEEQRKYKEKKKKMEKAAPPDTKVRVAKSEFFKTLASNLRHLRKVDLDQRRALYGPDVADVDFSSEDDDEYQIRNTRSNKRRRIEN
ncbi:hypothetical protein PILCRDRAFT_813299 [Piloderma croceum F 1598]|uniref:F-box domain-containing protein n=1 Tax=Piloderma croceum (strain F 1598) TaxID=765440 RepID=A0A0C3GFE6_PILCF|nr:hypothetical protein PILCRDRAFT_813299 [Piloderma croceum F 1598]